MDGRPRNVLPNNPREKANFLSKITFFWIIELFKKGYRKTLEMDDIYKPLTEDRSAALGDRLEEKWKAEVDNSNKPSLLKAIALAFWREYVFLGLIVITNDVLIRLGQPLLLGRLLTYFKKDSAISQSEALICAGSIVVLSTLGVFTYNHITFFGCYNGMKVRVAICSFIYRKSLKLSRIALNDTAAGKVINLLSNDVNRFDMVSVFLHWMWSSPLLALVIGYLLFIHIGWAGLIGLAVVLTVMPLQSFTGKLASKFRLQTAVKTDGRIRFIHEIISGIQVIKMYAWEKPLTNLMSATRKVELGIVRKSSYVRGLYMTFSLFTTRMALFCTMMTMVLLQNEISSEKVFMVSAYFNILAHTIGQMFVRGFTEIAEALVSLRRLQQFLELEEYKKLNDIHEVIKVSNGLSSKDYEKEALLNTADNNSDLPEDIIISMKNATADWNQQAPMTKNINFECKRGWLLGVMGPVGSGKSSLLHAILGELPLISGSIKINGTISYASQEPWIFAASVKQNVIFRNKMNTNIYQTVLKSCALKEDLKQFPHGDQTLIGERGSSLSGGQKARINLARSIYRQADIYILDDPLSAVDIKIARHLFDACIGPKSYLAKQKTTRVLVTHQTNFLKEADWIIVLKNGTISTQGMPSEILKTHLDVENLIENCTPQGSQYSLCDSNIGEVKLNNVNELQEMNYLGLENSSKGAVKGSVAGKYIQAGASPIFCFLLICSFLLTQFTASCADYWVSFWIRQEEFRNRQLNQTIQLATNSSLENEFITEFENNSLPFLLTTKNCLYISGCLVLGVFFIGVLRFIGFYKICLRASQKLHDQMFNGLISTELNFFDKNPSGRILNRFSKDLGAVDEHLPKVLLDACQMILIIIGAIIVTACVSPLFLFPVAILGLVFVGVRNVYLKTSKNIKRLDGITRSPVFTYISASLQGLPTIRASGAQLDLVQEFDGLQDTHTASWFIFLCCTCAFGQILDLLSVIFIFIVTFSFLLISNHILSDQVGLAITQSLALSGMLSWGIRQSAAVSNAMMSVERVLEYKDLKAEIEPTNPVEVKESWPGEGKIIFKNVSCSYSDEAESVLSNINLIINSREKIGIVGRTGAGKSSLIVALFRLAKIEGTIEIDGIDTSLISLNKLRSKISIIPQDPVLFLGSLRRNLDPFEEYQDSELWQALEEVELKGLVSSTLGLDFAVQAGGGNFSIGERQLICLARAILRSNKILVLDEATANIDLNTDKLIQQTIRRRFANCTVLTVSHRLTTILDSDRVIVMKNGKVAEFAAPRELLQIPNGIFNEMIHSTDERILILCVDASNRYLLEMAGLMCFELVSANLIESITSCQSSLN